MKWSKAKKELLQKQPDKIDILKLIGDSLEPIQKVHDQFMDCLLTEKVKENCCFLNEMHNRMILFNAIAWFASDFGEMKLASRSVKMWANYVELNWLGYRALKAYIDMYKGTVLLYN